MDNIISKVSQLKTFKRKLSEKGENWRLAKQTLERRLNQMQEQMSLLQANQTHPPGELSSIWSPSLPPGATKPPQIDIPLFAGDILKRRNFGTCSKLHFIKKRGMQRLINLSV